jgi:hypothetical protein
MTTPASEGHVRRIDLRLSNAEWARGSTRCSERLGTAKRSSSLSRG